MTTYYRSDGKALGTGRYFKGTKFRMSPRCHGCHIKINWMFNDERSVAEYGAYGITAWISVPELQYPEAIQRDDKVWHTCWMPCISPHYEMVYVAEDTDDAMPLTGRTA